MIKTHRRVHDSNFGTRSEHLLNIKQDDQLYTTRHFGKTSDEKISERPFIGSITKPISRVASAQVE